MASPSLAENLAPIQPIAAVRDEAQARSLLDPLRREILERLREPGSASTVADGLGLPRQRVNYHVRQMESEGLLQHVADRRRGNCVERVVRATGERYLIDPALFSAAGFGEGAPARPKLSFSADALAASASGTLHELAAHIASPSAESVPCLAVETAIRFRSPEAEVEFAKAIRELLSEMAERYHTPDAGGGRTFRITLGGHLSHGTPSRKSA